ncbi:hypothetical protein F4604DRAFT_1688140 [Suillus subluteus]|nr:hypothetical protein F4604DRAFT_1688140 [Suillus subluteus]
MISATAPGHTAFQRKTHVRSPKYNNIACRQDESIAAYAGDRLVLVKMKKIERIKRELRICANLNHASIYDYTHGFGPFVAIVSPWVENGNLSDYLKYEVVALTHVQRFQLASLHLGDIIAVHSKRVIHSDWEREDGTPVQPSKQSDLFSFGGIMLQPQVDIISSACRSSPMCEDDETIDNLLGLPPDQILLHWFNYHLKAAEWKRRTFTQRLVRLPDLPRTKSPNTSRQSQGSRPQDTPDIFTSRYTWTLHEDYGWRPNPICVLITSSCLDPMVVQYKITKRMFKDLHQVVFSIIILCTWTLVPTILKAEASRHIRIVALKNNITDAQQENPMILSLSAEIGSRGPIRLISLWKKCCFGYLVQANILDPVVFNFSAFVLDRITLTRQLETRYKWLHYHDSLTALESSTVGQGSSISAYSSDPQLQHAFSADWNWASIRAFDPLYSSDLADDMEAANFFEEVILVTSQLVASWDIVFPQVRETINLAIRSQDACLVQTNHPHIFSCSSTSFSALPGIGVAIQLSNKVLKDRLGNATEPES